MIEQIQNYRADSSTLWGEKYKIPWNENGFSERMLHEHLSQTHDLASRKDATIDRHVLWIHETILKEKKSTLLDLGCGPGLYLEKLHRLGHKCSGIDFSPASVAYARDHCGESNIHLGDIRHTEYGENYDLILLLYGEMNAFSPQECEKILTKTFAALRPGGILLAEPTLFDSVKKGGQAPPTWFRNNLMGLENGLFSEKPHIGLVESHWFEDEKVSLTNYWIFEEGKEQAEHYTNTLQGYTDTEYQSLFEVCGFQEVVFWGDFGKDLTSASSQQVISAIRK